MNELIRNLSPEDRHKLTKALNLETAKDKTGEMGALNNELRKKVVNGRYQWVHKAEILKEEKKRKQLAEKKRPIRALRDGENSLVNLIQKTLNRLDTKAEEMERMGYLGMMEKVDCINSAKTIQTRTDTLADDLSEIEKKIELTKCQNPIFAEAEKLLLLLSQLKQNGDMEQFQRLQKQYASLLSNYQMQRKTLMPLIESARHQRAGLQREYWRVLHALWGLLEKEFQKDIVAAADRINALEAGQAKVEIQEELTEAEQQTELIYDRKETLSFSIPSNLQPDPQSGNGWDEILPEMPALVDELEFMTQVMKSIHAKLETAGETKSTQPSSRMAFANRKPK